MGVIFVVLYMLHGTDFCTLLTFWVRRSREKPQYCCQENPAFFSYQLSWVWLLKLKDNFFQHNIYLSSELCGPNTKLWKFLCASEYVPYTGKKKTLFFNIQKSTLFYHNLDLSILICIYTPIENKFRHFCPWTNNSGLCSKNEYIL